MLPAAWESAGKSWFDDGPLSAWRCPGGGGGESGERWLLVSGVGLFFLGVSPVLGSRGLCGGSGGGQVEKAQCGAASVP